MDTMIQDELVGAVLEYYRESGDFNGLPAYEFIGDSVPDLVALKALLRPLVELGVLSVSFGDVHPNPHIRALPDRPIEKQLETLDAADSSYFVIYPTADTLDHHVDCSEYIGRPFSLRLALGAPQLEIASFDLAVLDHYRRDPRYALWTNDVQATLSITDDAFANPQFPEKHKVLLQSFGFSYTPDLRRAVAVFLIDLGRLTPEHQQIWAAFELHGDYRMHPDFWRAAIMGDWEFKASLSDAFVEELRVINVMCTAIGWPPLFRNAFDSPPRELAFLIRPTIAEYNEFVLVLDKLLSDNINIRFFPATISREQEETRPDGKVVVKTRGSLAMLGEWLRKSFRTPDPKPLDQMLATFREVRKRRQQPAHALEPDAYDESLFETQRQLFVRAYDALRTLRLILQNHPLARAAVEEMDERVRKGDIWSH
ncbi:MAG TPA: hypothetical protein VFW89_03175 [Gemmatimonadaceae bacterium]|nr:hypothetical protein [Gemmatimonadaceae bacterium]